MEQALSELVARKAIERQRSPAATIDWDARRNTYLAAVAALYSQVEQALAEAIAAGTVTSHRRTKSLTENYIGTYSVDDLILVIGGEQVRFSPAGRNVAGASGRVDVVGDRGDATLLVQPGPRWAHLQSRQPVLRAVPFSDAVLADVLTGVMRA